MTQQPSYLAPEPGPPTSGLAVASLVSGILGFTMLPLVGALVALLTGYAARAETRSVPPRAGGDSLATAGIIMGWVQIGLSVLAGLCVVVLALLFFLGAFAAWGQ